METRDEAQEDEQDELRERRYRDILHSADKLHDAVDNGPGIARYDYLIKELALADSPEQITWAATQLQDFLRAAAARAAE